MAILSTPELAPPILQPAEKIRASDLLAAFERFAPDIKVLSLDCFDTLLWRKTLTPTDLFYDLQHQPTFKQLGFTAAMRVTAESTARRVKYIQQEKMEVTLREIYLKYFPQLSDEQLNALTAEELAVEKASCYGFPPVVELIRAAQKRNIKIIVVSDTYFTQAQLTELLTACLPADIISAISLIFCSCEFDRTKSTGLFKNVLKALELPPQTILHIGDNPGADWIAPRQHDINSLHLVHQEEVISELMRAQTIAGNIIEPAIRSTRPCYYPFRGVFATSQIDPEQPDQLTGYVSLGPLMYAFARFIHDEIKEQQQQSNAVKVVFLLRDAYLPWLACKTLHGEEIGHRVRISRFTAIASSFRSKTDVSEYLLSSIGSGRLEDITNQLLIPKPLATKIIASAKKDKEPLYRFSRLIQQSQVLKVIFKESKQYRLRLKNYLEKEIGLAAGDTLMFVDLGYSGTAQRLLEPVFREEFGVNIIGRYLISLAVPQWNSTRKGLLDHTHCDERLMLTVVSYIALLEQVCTYNEKSVLGYDDSGNPIFSDIQFSEDQYSKLDNIHRECARFIQHAQQFFQAANIEAPMHMLRDFVIAELTRMLFFPTETEIEYLKNFEFDLNLGTKDTFNLLDIEKGTTGLKRHGLFYIAMERNATSFRTNTPAELRHTGMELVVTFMAQQRYTMEILAKDMSFRKERLDLLVINGEESTQTNVEAHPTHDGYFSLHLPLGAGNFQIGILFGMKYQWLEIESAQVVSASKFNNSHDIQHAEDYLSKLHFASMEQRGGKLYECLTTSAFAMIAPQFDASYKGNYVFRLVFRPITRRTDLHTQGEANDR